MIDIAERGLDDRQALEPVRRGYFIGHAHAAVKLHGLLADKTRSLSDAYLRRGNCPPTLGGLRARVTCRCEVGDRPGLHRVDQHFDHPVLQGLETPDRHTELLTLAGV